MPLILAIEPDRRQAAQLTTVVRKRVHAELILVSTTARALDAIGNRVPDLVLVPALLSPQDDAALAAALRVIAAAANVQMLTIPVLGTARPAEKSGGVLSALRRGKKSAEPEGCDPNVFAEQIVSYLERAAQERRSLGVDDGDAAPGNLEVEEVAAAPVGFEPVRAEVDPPPLEEFEPLPVEFVEPPAAAPVETSFAPVTDESVTSALEEAVRGLFAESPVAEPTWETPVAEPQDETPAVEPPSETPAPMAMAAEPPPEAFTEFVVDEPQPAPIHTIDEPPVEAVAEAITQTSTSAERAAVDELLAALQEIPLAAIEAYEEVDWTPRPVEAQELERDVTEEVRIVIEDPPAAHAEAPPVAAKSEREWVALIESLRLDVERLRTERVDKPAAKQPPSKPAARAAKPKKAKPVQDEWGFFDPAQCGFAALLAKLEEVTEEENTSA